MVDFLKRMLFSSKRKEENISEIHSTDNEPKFYPSENSEKTAAEKGGEIQEEKKEAKDTKTKLNSAPQNYQKPPQLQQSSAEDKPPTRPSEDVINNYKKEIETLKEENRKKNEETFKKINELKVIIKFNEDTHEENVKILKRKINEFINENIFLKEKVERINEEIKTKEREIENYKVILSEYQEIITCENSIMKKKTPTIVEPNLNDPLNLILNGEIEKLKTENLLIKNDLIRLAKENFEINKQNTTFKNQIISLKKEIKETRFSLNNGSNTNNLSSSIEFTNQSSKSHVVTINKLNSENYFLRTQLNTLKTKNYDLQSKVYSSNNHGKTSKEIFKLKNDLFDLRCEIIDLENEKKLIKDFILKEFPQLTTEKLKENLTSISILKFIQEITNKNFILNKLIKLNKERENSLSEDLKNFKLENEVLKDQLNDKKIELLSKQDYIDDYVSMNDTLKKEKYKYKKLYEESKEKIISLKNDSALNEYYQKRVHEIAPTCFKGVSVDYLHKIHLEYAPFDGHIHVTDEFETTEKNSQGFMSKILFPFFKK